MGRKTFESIGRPLPNRTNIILSRSLKIKGSDPLIFDNTDLSKTKPIKGTVPLIVKVCRSLEQALGTLKSEKAFIIGGAQIYKETLGQVKGIYVTMIHAEYEGDAFYPQIPAHFVEKERRTLQESPHLETVYYENRNML
jgi:dihydrofolate reductase